MTWAYVSGSEVVRWMNDLPRKHWVADSPDAGHYVALTVDNAAAFGYLPVTATERPADTATTTWVRDVQVVGAEVLIGWTERAKTAEEIADEAAALAAATEREQAIQAITSLRAYADLTAPTQAQTLNAVKLLCRVSSRLIVDVLT